jgi:DNA polymerase-1
VVGLAVAAPGLGAVRVAAPAGELEAALAAVEEGPDKVGHDLKPWIRHLWRRGRRWRPATFDAAVAAYLLDSGRSAYPLEDLARQYLGRRLPTGGDGSGGRGSARPDQEALAARAAAVLELRAPMEAELEARGLGPLFREVEMPLVEVLAAMEAHGVCVDREALAELDREFRRRLDEAAAAVHAAAGEAFNINSTQQLGRILFEKLGLKPPKKTKTGFSTDAEVLEQLALEHPLPERVLEYRTLQKLQSTYVQALGQLVDPRTGRVHTTFNQTVAATGRLSSEAPNLQNIPVREEIGRRIRRVFVAPPGAVLVSADYSQIDLRVLAHMSGDEGLVQAFRDGVDVHRRTAAEVFGVPLDAVTDSQRTAAKAVNFGLVYGISDFGLARQLRCDQAEARAIMDRYFARYPGVKAYMERVVAEARQRGFVRTLYGRIRYLPDIASRNWARRSFAERMAMNTPIQGTAADLVKRAMVRLHRELEAGGFGAALVLQVHDELILEAPLAERDRVARLARDAMEGAGTLSVPLVAEVKAGPNWYDMEPVRA